MGAPLRAQGRSVGVVVAAGEAGACIVGASADAALIVMMTRGQGLSQVLFGSTATHVLQHADVPALVIRDERAAALPFARLVVSLDGSDDAAEALPLAAAIGQQLGAAIHLVRAVDPGSWTASTGELERDAADYLERQRARLNSGAGLVTTEVRVAEAGRVPEQILAGTRPGDLVVVATRGQGGLRRRLMGSVAMEVLERATVPVVLVRSTPGMMEAALADLAEHSGSVEASEAI
jgi:nucleotide-binding universal stress UspA family protein